MYYLPDAIRESPSCPGAKRLATISFFDSRDIRNHLPRTDLGTYLPAELSGTVVGWAVWLYSSQFHELAVDGRLSEGTPSEAERAEQQSLAWLENAADGGGGREMMGRVHWKAEKDQRMISGGEALQAGAAAALRRSSLIQKETTAQGSDNLDL